MMLGTLLGNSIWHWTELIASRFCRNPERPSPSTCTGGPTPLDPQSMCTTYATRTSRGRPSTSQRRDETRTTHPTTDGLASMCVALLMATLPWKNRSPYRRVTAATPTPCTAASFPSAPLHQHSPHSHPPRTLDYTPPRSHVAQKSCKAVRIPPFVILAGILYGQERNEQEKTPHEKTPHPYGFTLITSCHAFL